MLRIDLGCGKTKNEGLCGLDRYALPGVDVVGDLDGELPFPSNSASLIYASHSLEHVRDLPFTIREIYRVLRHGGQLCIVAPYNEQKLNEANPYHLARFNEHTPRFWTNYPLAEIDPVEYEHPHAKIWGLLESDNSKADIDLRLVDMEFFYFPQYLPYNDQERRALRQSRPDVCDQIVYRLIAWKPSETDDDRPYETHVHEFVPYESSTVWNRRKADERRLRERRVQAGSVASPMQAAGELSHQTGSLNEIITYMRELVDDLIAANDAKAAARVSALTAEIEVSDSLLEEYKNRVIELESLAQDLERKLEEAVSSNQTAEHVQGFANISYIYNKSNRFRASRGKRFLSRLKRDNLWSNAPSTFASLKDYSSKHLKHRGFRLILSPDIRGMDYREYRIPSGTNRLSAIELAIAPIGPSKGQVGVELVSANGEILAHSIVNLDGINPCLPTRFNLQSKLSLSANWALRIFTRNASGPVAAYELIDPAPVKRRPRFNAFVSLLES